MSVDIQFNADQALAKLGELVAKHGPQAVDMAAAVLQTEALGTLVRGVVLLAASATAVIAGRHFLRMNQSAAAEWDAYRIARDQHDYPSLYPTADKKPPARPSRPLVSEEATAFGIVTGFVVAGCFAAAAAAHLLGIWTWVALFNPKLALAHEVIAKFAGS